jgi:hypothetical protein
MNLICRIIGHKTFVNQEFCIQTGALGPRTLRCRRCWFDVKELEPINE